MVATYYKKKQRNVAKKALKNNYNFSGNQKNRKSKHADNLFKENELNEEKKKKASIWSGII